VGAFKPKLLIFSDYVCPFCYLALEVVERLSQDYSIEIVWKNYEIHPATSPSGSRMLNEGEEARAESRLLCELNPELGPRIHLPPIIANTHLAHEAAEFAHEQGKFPEMHKRLFQAYFEQGLNISELPVLLRLGREVGLYPAALEQAICEHRYHNRIERTLQEKMWYGVYGTPTFVLGRYKIAGPQRYEVFQELMCRVGAQSRTAA
jgi:predicted DsbA family dithiol-disulfide isomerase